MFTLRSAAPRAVLLAHLAGVLTFMLASKLDSSGQLSGLLKSTLLSVGIGTFLFCPLAMIAILWSGMLDDRHTDFAVLATIAFACLQFLAFIPLVQ
jgi:hypothetical protein